MDMKKDSLFRRLFSVEVLGGALAGAALPYGVALVIKVAPTRVPVGVVAISIGGGALLGWLLVRAVNARRRKLRAAQERKARQLQELQEQLARIEQNVARIRPARKGWPKWPRQQIR